MTDGVLELLIDSVVYPLARGLVLDTRVDDRYLVVPIGRERSLPGTIPWRGGVLFVWLRFRRWPFWGRRAVRDAIAQALGPAMGGNVSVVVVQGFRSFYDSKRRRRLEWVRLGMTFVSGPFASPARSFWRKA